jgi:hypothetical protein
MVVLAVMGAQEGQKKNAVECAGVSIVKACEMVCARCGMPCAPWQQYRQQQASIEWHP